METEQLFVRTTRMKIMTTHEVIGYLPVICDDKGYLLSFPYNVAFNQMFRHPAWQHLSNGTAYKTQELAMQSYIEWCKQEKVTPLPVWSKDESSPN